MSTLAAPMEFEILSRVVRPEDPMFSHEAAREILAMSFDADAIGRINQLSELARAGTLSPVEQEELDNYERVGHILGILQSKARRSLREATDT